MTRDTILWACYQNWNIGPTLETSRPNKELKDYFEPQSIVPTTCYP